MARRSREQRALDYTPEALADLDAIWDWNTGQYGQAQADRYIEFLQSQTNRLRRNLLGRPVPTRPDFRYVTIRRRSRGHGHVMVYEVIENVIRILRYFHTSQDWQNKVAGEG